MQGTMKTDLFYKDFDSPGFSIPAGTPGLFVDQISVNIAEQGKIPVAATVLQYGHPAAYCAVLMIYGNILYIDIYRGSTESYSYSTGEIRVRVLYK